MLANFVIDVGNTRVKWGYCQQDTITRVASLPPDSPTDWQNQLADWQVNQPSQWVIAGVHPQRVQTLSAWLTDTGHAVQLLESPDQLPLEVKLERPEHAGLDRLLNAVAANAIRPADHAALLIDAGSAVTVDLVDSQGAFRGGAITPGVRLMTEALHSYTALLPRVTIESPPSHIGHNTIDAMKSGIFWSIIGGIEKLIELHTILVDAPLSVYLTGGDAALLATHLPEQCQVWPEMTLEGIRLSALAMNKT